MVDFQFTLSKTKLLENLKDANEFCATELGRDGEAYFCWQKDNLKFDIQEDFLMAEDGFNWITVDGNDFTSDMLVALIEENPALATEEVMLALFRAVGMK